MLPKLINKIPKIPLSALIFYCSALLLWQLEFIPSPYYIVVLLENLYADYGLIGLFIASFLEGIVYLGLYFPGSFIVALAVILSDGSFKSLLSISFIVALALTISSVINYNLGKGLFKAKIKKKLVNKSKNVVSKSFLSSFLHPNILAFYFFNEGLKNHNPLKLFVVPLIMLPYGLILGYLFYSIKDPLKSSIDNPYIMISTIMIWLILAIFIQNIKTNK